MSGDAAGRGTVQSVGRALAVVDALAARGGIAGLNELSADTGLAAATVHRLCATLVASGHLRRGGEREYVLGPRLQRAGEVAARRTAEWVLPALERLVEVTGETANMAMRDGDEVVYLAQVPSPHSMRMFTEVGRRVELHCSAVGKALAATEDPEAVLGALRRAGMRAYTAATITEAGAYLTELEGVRTSGIAEDAEEHQEGVRCVAAAHGSGPAAVALSVSGPEARFTAGPRARAAAELRSVVAGLGGPAGSPA